MTPYECALVIEALAMAASRHEAMGRTVRGFFMRKHDEKAAAMRILRARLSTPMKFVVSELADTPFCWRATAVAVNKTTDVFFYAPTLDAAKDHVRWKYPQATFYGDEEVSA